MNYKDKLPAGMRSYLDYELSCAHCASKYDGSTISALCSRVAEHAGRSSRTGNILLHPSHSKIRLYVESKCDVDLAEDNLNA